mgnify:CR=1 FL=1|jgi:hypothetical protein
MNVFEPPDEIENGYYFEVKRTRKEEITHFSFSFTHFADTDSLSQNDNSLLSLTIFIIVVSLIAVNIHPCQQRWHALEIQVELK